MTLQPRTIQTDRRSNLGTSILKSSIKIQQTSSKDPRNAAAKPNPTWRKVVRCLCSQGQGFSRRKAEESERGACRYLTAIRKETLEEMLQLAMKTARILTNTIAKFKD